MTHWTELHVKGWRTVLPLMQRLGVHGAYDTFADRTGTAKPELSAASLGEGGSLMMERGPVMEEFTPDGLVGIHLIWDSRKHTLRELAEMMSVDAPYWSGLPKHHAKEILDLYVPGQRRLVALLAPPARMTAAWEGIYELAAERGACDLHYVPLTTPDILPVQYRHMFSGIFKSATVTLTGKTVCVPNGTRLLLGELWDRPNVEEWTKLVGFDFEQLSLEGPLGVKNRRALSLASAFWASRNWDNTREHLIRAPKSEEWAEKVASMGASPDLLVTTRSARLAIKKQKGASTAPAVGDMIACDACTLFDACRLARAGSICLLPESDMGELAEQFRTRNAVQVVDGLGELLARQAERVEQRMEEEKSGEEVHEDVTKMVTSLFDRGVKLAKLLDPRLNGGPRVAVNVGGPTYATIEAGSPQQLASAVVAELEARGVRREDITPDMISSVLELDSSAVKEKVEVPAADRVSGVLPEAP